MNAPVFRHRPPRPVAPVRVYAYLYATLVTAAAFAVAFLARRYLALPTLSLIFITAVVAVAVRTRMGVAVYTAVLCFLGYNFFFTPPRYTLAISSAGDIVNVGLFLVVALVCGRLASHLTRRVASLRAAQVRTQALVGLGQQLAAGTDAAAIRTAGVAALAEAVQAEALLLQREHDGVWRLVAASRAQSLPVAAVLTAAAVAPRELDDGQGGHWRLLPCPEAAGGESVMALRFADAATASVDHHGLERAMVRDIGMALERARLAEALQQARLDGETDRLRNALLSSVSHDLRSPLVAMIGAAGTLSAYEAQLPAEERRQLVESILQEGQRLDRYIQNLLDMTRLGHGTLRLNRDWVDAGEIVLAALARLRRLFPQQRVTTTLPTDTVLLYVHPALIEQALFNVLENAAHFSPPQAAVSVSVRVGDGVLTVEIGDRGPGIPAAQRAHVFDRFYSVARGDRGNHGTGLGLYICRGMIGAHGGEVEAVDGPAGGTVVRITLPLPPAPESSP